MSRLALVAERQRYHHGDLRRAVLDGAIAVIAEHGPGALSLRDIARKAGVSHAAPAHHFGDKAGVLTAIAIEGFEGLAAATGEAMKTRDIVEGGVAYIRYAVDHPAHYEVMFRPDLLRNDDPGLNAARASGAAVLLGAVRGTLPSDASDEQIFDGVMAAWAFGHGFASLWSRGNVPVAPDTDAEAVARRAAAAFVQMVMAGASTPR